MATVTGNTNTATTAITALLLCAVTFMFYACGSGENPAGPVYNHEPFAPSGPFVLIEKARWGLVEGDCTAEAGDANSAALQRAIDSLTGAGRYRLKLEQGDYCLWGIAYEGKRVVKIPSFVELDLGGSTLQLAAYDWHYTSILRIEQAENVKIFNGTLIGDRLTHNYDITGSDHYGAGIWVHSSVNVELSDLTISDVTGDCVTIGEISPKCYDVTIDNVTCSRARRGGFVATNVKGLIIRNSHVFDITNDVPTYYENGGAVPIGAEACIAFETTGSQGGTQEISNVRIYNNILDGSSGRSKYDKLFINTHGGSKNIVIHDNEIYGSFDLRYGKNILLKNNRISDGYFIPGGAVDLSHPIRLGENIIIENNEFHNYEIESTGGGLYSGHPDYKQNFAFIGNKFYDTNVTLVSPTSMAFIDNLFVDVTGVKNGCVYIRVENPPKDGEKFRIYFAGNTAQGDFTYPLQYFIPIIARPNTITLQLDEAPDYTMPIPSQMPEWFYKSRGRDEAVAWVDSWRWY